MSNYECLENLGSDEFESNCDWLKAPKEFEPLTDEEIELLNKSKIEGVYEENEGLRFSTLKRYIEAPWYYDNHEMEPIESKACLSGSAFHCYLLEPAKFEEKYRVFQAPINKTTGKPYLSGKAYDTALDEFKKSGYLPLDEGEKEKFDTMLASALASNYLDYFTDGIAELPLATSIEGNPVKCKIDYLSRKYGIVDIKTTSKDITNASGDDSFRWEIRDRAYTEQLVYYQSIVESIIGRTIPCTIMVFENHKPYRVARYKLSTLARERAKNNVNEWKTLYYSGDKQYKNLDWLI